MITVFAYYTPNFQELANVTLPNIRRYCQRHGYSLNVHYDADAMGTDIPIGFHKTREVLNKMRTMKHGDVLFVIDIDLIITNQTILLESFLDEEHDLFFTHDVNGLNSGAYLIRNTFGTQKFLEDVLERRGQPGVFGEQDGMRDSLLVSSFGSLCKIVPHPAFNSFDYLEYGLYISHEKGQWREGDFILHLPGVSNERRIEILTGPVLLASIVE